ncbi:LUD domain-containing protein [Acidocella sp. KAb 2-4]|uniref:LUD domain-containing protein n=1 Tax=Acidocella sp. KAb 2-4 TaxID=2885158 RepID=UPI001D0769B5|nr:LUD domain-containing protein [Acidocella sp. KAb 2-4]MCB5944218.1 lactate utilization protein [Acidocella sp. KAb 2-4]
MQAPYAVAETGSLVFRSGPDMPVLFALLPCHHLVVLEAASIVPWLEDAAALEAQRPATSNLKFVNGPSSATDIEGTLVRGAHGPGFLHIILVGSPNS